MLSKYKYKMILEVAPARITWTQELVDDPDSGDFYVKLVPRVEWAEDLIEKGPVNWDGSQRIKFERGSLRKRTPLGVLGANKRNQYAEQGRKIFEELKKDLRNDVQNKLRIQRNKMTGQRWNKKG